LADEGFKRSGHDPDRDVVVFSASLFPVSSLVPIPVPFFKSLKINIKKP
jgi:hypothetical protein